MSQAARLRALMASDELIIAPGAFECVTAKAVEHAGFSAVYMSGGWTAMMLGYPDYGLTTMTEMADNAGRIAAAVDIPVIADADTGFGNELNAIRTVQEYEKRGVAGLHIEDQVFPKRCGHLDGKEVVAADDFIAKIRAVASMRTNPDTLVIARTDARSVLGFDEAVSRMNAAFEAGADVGFLEAPQSMDEVALIPKLLKGHCLLNVNRGGKTPPIEDLDEVRRMGYKIAILPGALMRPITETCDRILADIRSTGRFVSEPKQASIKEAFKRADTEKWDKLRIQFR